MQDLFDMIYTYKCHEHQQPLERICIKVKCTHRSRGLCRKCPKLDDVSEVLLSSLFNFIEEEQQKSSNKDDYKVKASLYQQFMRLKRQVFEYVDQLQATLESLFYSISESFIAEFRNWGMQTIGKQVDTQALGVLLSRTIQASQDHQHITYLQQSKLGYALGLKEAQKCISQLNIHFQQKQEQLSPEQSEYFSEYKLTKTIQLENACWSLCFNHNETQIAVVQYNKIQIFNEQQVGGGNWIQYGEPLIGHGGFIYQVQFNHISTQLVSCDEVGLIIIYGKQLDGQWTIQHRIQRDEFPVHTICFNHNSNLIASGNYNNTIQIYEFSYGKWLKKQDLTEHSKYISIICFNHNSSLMASGSCDESIIIWRLNNEKWIVRQKLAGHSDGVQIISFNNDSTSIVSGGNDNLVKVWAVDSSGIWACSQALIGHTDTVLSLQFNSQQNMIVSNSDDRTIMIWIINYQGYWECAQTIPSNYQARRGIILNKSNQIIFSSENQIMLYDQDDS